MAVRTISFRSDEFGALLPVSLESRGILVLNVILWKLRAEVRRTPLGRLGASRLLESPERHLLSPEVP
jgi:hypothetical protein